MASPAAGIKLPDLAALEARVRALGDPERAAHDVAYFKSPDGLVHWGVPVPRLRDVATEIRRTKPDHDAVMALATSLWSTDVHDLKGLALVLLEKEARRFVPADLDVLEGILRASHTWAYVDVVAVHMVGPLVARHPELGARLDAWSRDGNFWMRRSAMLALLLGLRAGAGDFERFARYADAMLDEKEFFVRKAIGWILRETGRKTPDRVVEWLLPRAKRASGVTWREAMKPLPPEQRDALDAARGS